MDLFAPVKSLRRIAAMAHVLTVHVAPDASDAATTAAAPQSLP
jgi:hypothetical protein